MKARLTHIMLVIILLCAVGAQAWGMAADLDWEQQVSFVPGSFVPSVAVDQNDGSIYVACYINSSSSMVIKYDKDGSKLGEIGPNIYNNAGVLVHALGGNQPRSMAVDPLTGFLWVFTHSPTYTAYIVDTTLVSTEPGVSGKIGQCYKGGNQTPVGNSGKQRGIIYQGDGGTLAFSDDGKTLVSTGFSNRWRSMVRNENATPADYTDDYFNDPGTAGTDTALIDHYNGSGILTPGGFSDPRGAAFDRNRNVWISDWANDNRPIKRYPATLSGGGNWIYPAATMIDFEFKPRTRCRNFGIDAQNRVWVGDVVDSVVRVYNNGVELTFDAASPFVTNDPANGKHIWEPMNVICDWNATRVPTTDQARVIVVGKDAASSTATYVQVWNVTSIPVPTGGTVIGRIVDDAGNPVSGALFASQSPYISSTNPPAIGYGPVAADGTFSRTVPVGLNTFVAQAAGKLNTRLTHYDITDGSTTNLGDIVLLPNTSDFVTATLGAHNVEQGLFMSTSDHAGINGESQFKISNEAGSIGGRECRSFGNNDLQQYMVFDVQNGYFTSGTPTPCWLEADIYDSGLDRFSTQFDIKQGAEVAPVVSMGFQPKTNTNVWKTWKWYRADGEFNNSLGYVDTNGSGYSAGDFRFGALNYDSSAPRGPKHVAKVTVRKAPAADDESYLQIDKVGDAKKFIYGQHHLSDPGVRYAGGFAVKLTGKTVVDTGAIFEGYYISKPYALIEDPDRSSGIRVMLPSGMFPWDVNLAYATDITGAVMCDPDTQELVIHATSFVQHIDQPAEVIKPIAWSNLRGVCGGGLTYTLNSGTNTYSIPIQPGVFNGTGVPTAGMSVRFCGRVTAIGDIVIDGATFQYAYVDDGSQLKGEGVLGEADKIGVKVILSYPTAPTVAVADFLTVAGVCRMGLYDPTPADFNNGDHWRYTMVDATSVEKN